MLPCVCSVKGHRWRQNVVRKKSGTRGAANLWGKKFIVYAIFTVSALTCIPTHPETSHTALHKNNLLSIPRT